MTRLASLSLPVQPIPSPRGNKDTRTWLTRPGLVQWPRLVTVIGGVVKYLRRPGELSLAAARVIPFHFESKLHTPLLHISLTTMLPLFGADDKKRRNINLGGRSTSSTHTSILDEARLRREQRQNQLKQQKSAIRIQAWWRGKRESRIVRIRLRHALEQDPAGINGLRAVVLIGQDEESLAIWSRNVLQSGESKWGPLCLLCVQLTPP